MEGFAGERVGLRRTTAFKQAGDFCLRGSALKVNFEFDWQEQRVPELRTSRSEHGEDIAQRLAGPTGKDGLKRRTLSGVGGLVDDDLALTAAVGDFARPFVDRGPFQPGQRGFVIMPLDDAADVGRLAEPVRGGQVELAAAIDLAIAVIKGLAFEVPLVRHGFLPWLVRCSG